MTESLSVSDARRDLAQVIARVRDSHEPIFLSRRGTRVAAVVNADDYERLREMAEDMADVRAAAAAREEMRRTGETPIPWDEVKAELGLV